MIDDVKIPLGFRRIQAARLVDWQGKLPDAEFDILLESVSGILGSAIETEKEEIEVQEEARGEAVEFGDERAKKSIVKRENKIKNNEEIPKTYTNSIGMKFMLIPAGEFIMGSESSDDEKPMHKVRINKPFYLGIYPVTQQEWIKVMGKNFSEFKGDNLPAEHVHWTHVQQFIEKLNTKESSSKYRLPSEAEWEYAARADTKTRYFFGNDESKLGDYAWYVENSGNKTHPVGQKKPNPWGLYDIYGNVWEYTQDSWHGNYKGAPTDGSTWKSDFVYNLVARGGSWNYYAWACRSAYRGIARMSNYCGFRLLMDL